jgi:RNA polymerase sigma factor (sigma-70 family)
MEKELTLAQYTKFARKIASKYKRSNDDDCVAAIINRLAISYRKFNGMGNIKAYMYRMGDYACKSYLYRLRPDPDIVFHPLTDAIESKHNTVQNAINKEIIEKLPELMNEREVKITTSFYLSNMTLKEISKEHNISEERVRQIIKKAVEKARIKLND